MTVGQGNGQEPITPEENEPQVSVEDLQRFEQENPPPNSQLGPEGEVVDPTSDPEPQATPTPDPEPAPIILDDSEEFELAPGYKFTRAELANLASLAYEIQQDPNLERLIVQYYESPPSPQPGASPTAPTPEGGSGLPGQAPPPIDLSTVTPEVAYLYQQQQELQAQLATQQAILQSQRRAANQEVVDSAKASFAQAHSLSPAEIDQLEREAMTLEILPGLAARKPLHEAVTDTLETAYWRNPQFRAKEFANNPQLRQQAESRKRKLAGISGNSGSSPRETPYKRPTSMAEARQGATEEAKALMGLD